MGAEEEAGVAWPGRRKQVLELIDDVVFLTEEKAAEFLGVSHATLSRWRLQKKGPPHYKIGERRITYKKRDLEAWVESRKSG